jgi:ribA/ribD-fused uncharacterized protein
MSPLLDIESLVLAIASGYEPKWLLFWGHMPSKDGSLGKTCFSQWWDRHPFALDGITYRTAEHFMMVEKARLFGDEEASARVLEARSPAEAKKLGRLVKGFTDEAWLEARWDIVVRGNEAKFSQHADLKDFLLCTGDRVLVEASPFDRIWGIGMGATHADAEKPQNWKGLNLLGFALMEVRSRLSK